MITYTLYILFIIASAKVDAEHYLNKQYFTDHTSRFWLRVLATAMAASSVIDLFLLASIFYLLFDLTFNMLVGNKWYYIGGTSKIDRFWRKYPKLQYPFKLLLFIICLTIKILI